MDFIDFGYCWRSSTTVAWSLTNRSRFDSFGQTHSLSADTGVYFYAWSFVGLLFFLADYLLPGYIAKRGGGSKAASKGATIGLLVGLITGPGMFVGAFIGAFIGQYSSNNSVGKSLQSAFLATLGITLGIIGKLIYTLSAVALVLSLASI
jgi:uncharacterized protein YqgC (DUF456 family)